MLSWVGAVYKTRHPTTILALEPPENSGLDFSNRARLSSLIFLKDSTLKILFWKIPVFFFFFCLCFFFFVCTRQQRSRNDVNKLVLLYNGSLE
jgi:hypothetical protein